MVDFQTLCHQKIQELQSITKLAKKELEVAPKGTLHTLRKEGLTQYYYKPEESGAPRKYIKRTNTKLAQQLAQKEYANKILAVAEKSLRNLIKLSNAYSEQDIVQVYANITEAKRALIKPYIQPQDEFVVTWYQEKAQCKEKMTKDRGVTIDEEDGIFTERGEQVRSKSEKMLADKLFMMNIPYVYEVPLYLKGFGTVMPDFLVLNIRTREEYYWEHFGMMDQNNYCEKAIKKVECYEKNNIFLGQKLLLTFETDTHPLNMPCVEKLIREYLM